MITNMPAAEYIIRDLHNSKFLFYLTGSRFFGTAKKDSDWDFFVEDSPEVRSWLVENKFYLVGPVTYSEDDPEEWKRNDRAEYIRTYWDRNTVEVYEHFWGIHIQLVRDVSAKEDVQNIIQNMLPYIRVKNKKDWRNVWDALYDGISFG